MFFLSSHRRTVAWAAATFFTASFHLLHGAQEVPVSTVVKSLVDLGYFSPEDAREQEERLMQIELENLVTTQAIATKRIAVPLIRKLIKRESVCYKADFPATDGSSLTASAVDHWVDDWEDYKGRFDIIRARGGQFTLDDYAPFYATTRHPAIRFRFLKNYATRIGTDRFSLIVLFSNYYYALFEAALRFVALVLPASYVIEYEYEDFRKQLAHCFDSALPEHLVITPLATNKGICSSAESSDTESVYSEALETSYDEPMFKDTHMARLACCWLYHFIGKVHNRAFNAHADYIASRLLVLSNDERDELLKDGTEEHIYLFNTEERGQINYLASKTNCVLKEWFTKERITD